MAQISVKAATILDARPEDVYAAIADYQHGHPNILPKESFYDLQVEQGGYGAGTIIHFKMKVLDLPPLKTPPQRSGACKVHLSSCKSYIRLPHNNHTGIISVTR